MAIKKLLSLDPSYGDESGKYTELIVKGSLRSNTGNVIYQSKTSGVVYNTANSTDPNILNKGETGLLYWLGTILDVSLMSLEAYESIQEAIDEQRLKTIMGAI